MSRDGEHHDATALLRAEHAVAGVLAEVCDEQAAYPRLLEAIGSALGWEVGAVWQVPVDDAADGLRCVETWPGPGPFEQVTRALVLARGEGLPGHVWDSAEPAWVSDVEPSPNFPRARSAAR